ncbi:DUF433 domain-containing protein [Dyadobacter fermentans]|uniref:DUF433 domain-containing protein n=1 Tax=Dyadobacter fermentans TaxID=94254 RepID=UPI00019B5779|nr:DUF433 domain-containing protein [Dyadobacter fermentans]
MTHYDDFVSSEPGVMLGKPVIKGTRIAVEQILRKLKEGATVSDLMAMYPGVSRECILCIIDKHK